jgi:hypothetical protein
MIVMLIQPEIVEGSRCICPAGPDPFVMLTVGMIVGAWMVTMLWVAYARYVDLKQYADDNDNHGEEP